MDVVFRVASSLAISIVVIAVVCLWIDTWVRVRFIQEHLGLEKDEDVTEKTG